MIIVLKESPLRVTFKMKKLSKLWCHEVIDGIHITKEREENQMYVWLQRRVKSFYNQLKLDWHLIGRIDQMQASNKCAGNKNGKSHSEQNNPNKNIDIFYR